MTTSPWQMPEGKFSRRRFVAGLGAAAGTVVLWPECLRAAAAREEVSLIVISDTHLGYRDKTHAASQWEATAAELKTAPGDLILHLGDVVDAGREEQYPIYKATRDTIGKPVHEIPGNHDPHELFEKHIRRPIDKVVDHHWVRFLLIGNAHRDSHDGFLTAEQIAWMDAQCREAAKEDRYVMLCMHVPAHANRHPDRGWYVKPEHGKRELDALLARHKDRVLALMHGHFHNGIRGWNDADRPHEIIFPSVLYNLDRGLEEKQAPGYNLPEFRPGYTLMTLSDGAIKLRYKPQGETETTDKECRLNQLGS